MDGYWINHGATMGGSALPNPAFDLIDNATDFVAYAIRQNYSQSSIDGRMAQLVRFLEALN